jgi:hypothetical protein
VDHPRTVVRADDVVADLEVAQGSLNLEVSGNSLFDYLLN